MQYSDAVYPAQPRDVMAMTIAPVADGMTFPFAGFEGLARSRSVDEDNLPGRGLANGLLLSSVLWVAIAGGVFLVRHLLLG